jgi:hypothetical protein
MAYFIYSTAGEPQGFRLGEHIFTMDGVPVGRVFAEKVYKLGGSYVGVLINNMVLDKSGVSRRSLPPVSAPPHAQPPRGAEMRRPVCEAFADSFELLISSATSAAVEADARNNTLEPA